MRVLINGQYVPAGDITVRSSIFDYSTILSFNLPAPVPVDEIQIEIDDTLSFVPVSIEKMDSTAVKYTCYPKGYWEFLNKVSQPISMDGTVPELLDALALGEYVVLHATDSAHWVLPALRGKTLMDYLTKHVTAVDGGCPFAYFNMAGGLVWGDVLSECLTDPKGTFIGTLTEQISTNTYMAAVPGIVHITFFDEDSYTTKDVTFLKDAPQANLFRYASGEDEKRYTIAELQSNFWRRKVATTTTKFDNVILSGISPGLKVQDAETNICYVLTTYETVYSQNGIENKIELFPSTVPEQDI